MDVFELFLFDRDHGDSRIAMFSTNEKAMQYADAVYPPLEGVDWRVWDDGAVRSLNRFLNLEVTRITLDRTP